MNRILITLCVFFALIISANAGELYSCIDRKGKTIVTNSPQDGMTNCVLKDTYKDPTPDEKSNEEGKASERKSVEERNAREQKSMEEKKAREQKKLAKIIVKMLPRLVQLIVTDLILIT